MNKENHNCKSLNKEKRGKGRDRKRRKEKVKIKEKIEGMDKVKKEIKEKKDKQNGRF